MTVLCDLAVKYGTDKGTKYKGGSGHGYTPFYHKLFQDIQVKRLLEIGICWEVQAASLRMWEEYFPEAEIIGLDIDPAKMVNDGRIKSYLVNQASGESLGVFVFAHPGPYDVIIDDGSHALYDQIISAIYLMPCLNKNGVYIVEDVQNARGLRDALSMYSTETIEFNPDAVDGRIVLIRHK